MPENPIEKWQRQRQQIDDSQKKIQVAGHEQTFLEWRTHKQLVLEREFLNLRDLIRQYMVRCVPGEENDHPFCNMNRRIVALLTDISGKQRAYQFPKFLTLEMGDEYSSDTLLTDEDAASFATIEKEVSATETEWADIKRQLNLPDAPATVPRQETMAERTARERAEVEAANIRAGVSTPSAVTSEAGRLAQMRAQAEAENIASAVRREGVSMTAAESGSTENRVVPQVAYEVILTRERTRSIESLIAEDTASYTTKGLTRWADEVRTLTERWNRLSSEERQYIEQKRREGWLVVGMPSARTLLDTMLEALNVLRPHFGRDRATANQATVYWDYAQKLINDKNQKLINNIPEQPYFFLFQPSEHPPQDSCNKTVDEQKQWIDQLHRTDPHLFAEQLGEYIAAQTRLTEKGGEPMDAVTWLRLIELPLRGGSVVRADWDPSHRKLRVGRDVAGLPYASKGVRVAGRV